jgi:hypothetical protein
MIGRPFCEVSLLGLLPNVRLDRRAEARKKRKKQRACGAAQARVNVHESLFDL